MKTTTAPAAWTRPNGRNSSTPAPTSSSPPIATPRLWWTPFSMNDHSMQPARFRALTKRYRQLRIAVAGDFCLDRYLEINPARKEISIETGLPVHNVVRARSQPGGAGTILNNLAALGVAEIFPVGFAGDDGEGFELKGALGSLPGIRMEAFLLSAQR